MNNAHTKPLLRRSMRDYARAQKMRELNQHAIDCEYEARQYRESEEVRELWRRMTGQVDEQQAMATLERREEAARSIA